MKVRVIIVEVKVVQKTILKVEILVILSLEIVAPIRVNVLDIVMEVGRTRRILATMVGGSTGQCTIGAGASK
jgi:hypothetical protein